MKTLAAFTLSVVLAATSLAPVRAGSPQLTPEDYLNLLRIDLRASKAEVVAEAMELSAAEADVFWPIYTEYDGDLSRLNADRISLLREFAACYTAIDDAKAAEMSRRTFELMERRLDLLQKYSRRLARATSPLLAARFAQIESHLQMLVDVQLASEFPLVPRAASLAPSGTW